MATIRGLLHIFSATLGFAPLGVSQAADIRHETAKDGTEIIMISGSLERGDEERFRDLTVKYPEAIVGLASPGGLLVPALEIGRLIRLRSYSTIVLSDDTCASSCALIWLAGTPRILQQGGRIGFHASYRDEGGQNVESGVANAVVGHYLSQLSLSEKAVVFATKASPYEVTWLDAANRSASGIDFEVVSAPNAGTQQAADEQPPRVSLAPPPVVYTTPSSAIAAPEVQASLLGSIASAISPNWRGNAPAGPDTEKLVTILTWNLNRNGELVGSPRVVRQEGITDANRSQATRHAEQAIRAVQLAAPFNLPSQYYEIWSRVTFRFDQRLGGAPSAPLSLTEQLRATLLRPGMAENAAKDIGTPIELQPIIADHLYQLYRIPGLIDRLAQELSGLPLTGSNAEAAAREVSAALTVKLSYQGYARLGSTDVRKFFNVMGRMTQQMTDAECDTIFRSSGASNGPVEFIVIARQGQGELNDYLALMRKAIAAELSQSPAAIKLSVDQAKAAEDAGAEALMRGFSAYSADDRTLMLEAFKDPSKARIENVCRGYRVLFPTVASMPGLVGDWYRRVYLDEINQGS